MLERSRKMKLKKRFSIFIVGLLTFALLVGLTATAVAGESGDQFLTEAVVNDDTTPSTPATTGSETIAPVEDGLVEPPIEDGDEAVDNENASSEELPVMAASGDMMGTLDAGDPIEIVGVTIITRIFSVLKSGVHVPYIVDGVPTEHITELVVGDKVNFTTHFELAIEGKGYKEGDYIQTLLPSQFTYSNSNILGTEVDGTRSNGTTFKLGVVTIVTIGAQKYLRLTLDADAVDEIYLYEGIMFANGTANSESDGDDNIVYDGMEIPIIIVPKPPGPDPDPNPPPTPPTVVNPGGGGDGEDLVKNGWFNGTDKVLWTFFPGQAGFRNFVNNGVNMTYQNAYLSDPFPKGFIQNTASAPSVDFTGFNWFTESGRYTSSAIGIGDRGVLGGLNWSVVNDASNPADLKTKAMSLAAPAYGYIYDAVNDQYNMGINLGDIPGTLAPNLTFAELKAWIINNRLNNPKYVDSNGNMLTEDTPFVKVTLEKWEEALNAGWAPLRVAVTNTITTTGTVENTASLEWSGGGSSAKVNVVIVNDVGGGATTESQAKASMLKSDELSGKPIKDIEWKLQKKNASGEFVDHTTGRISGDDGMVVFTKLTPGTYKFVEVDAPGYILGSIKFDTSTGISADGVFTVTGKETSEFLFEATNMPIPNGTLIAFSVNKVLVNDNLVGGDYQFIFEDANGLVSQTKYNDANGDVIFDPITYDYDDYVKSKKYTYTVYEVIGTAHDIDYDKKIITIDVDLTLDSTQENVVADATYSDVNRTFENTYIKPIYVDLFAHKKWSGTPWPREVSYFRLLNGDGTVRETVASNIAGIAAFSSLNFDRPGTYRFKVFEVKGSDPNVTYDPTVYDVVIVIDYDKINKKLVLTSLLYSGSTKIPEFMNKYRPPLVPKLSDDTNLPGLIATVITALALLSILAVRMRKRSKNG